MFDMLLKIRELIKVHLETKFVKMFYLFRITDTERRQQKANTEYNANR